MHHAPTITSERDALERLHAMEAELVAVRRELEHTHRLATIGTITAGVAHEINNLLTPALAYAQRAASDPEDTALLQKAVEKSRAGIDAASRILEAVLGFSCAEEEPNSARPELALQAAIDCIGRDLSKDGITIERRIPTDLACRIRPLALQQVLLNLLLNACKALRPRGGRIVVSAETPDNKTVRIAVADTGPGIPEEIISTLFEPFVTAPIANGRSSGRRADQQGGSGLGLTVCRRTIEAAGGTIAVDSSPGEGATFRIDLPAAPEA
jgi:signal transduction histidine kinase